MTTKHCPKCNTTKQIDEFYKNASARDGHQVWCKACWKADCAARTARDPDNRRSVSLRSFHKRRAEGKPLHPSALTTRPYDEKTRARRILQAEVRAGRIVKGPCCECGTVVDIDAHHSDYSKPLDIEWLCRLCHAKRHRGQWRRGLQPSSGQYSDSVNDRVGSDGSLSENAGRANANENVGSWQREAMAQPTAEC